LKEYRNLLLVRRANMMIPSPGEIDSSAFSSNGSPPTVSAMSRNCRRGGMKGSRSVATDEVCGSKGKGAIGLVARWFPDRADSQSGIVAAG
jgi:hypothetical protein